MRIGGFPSRRPQRRSRRGAAFVLALAAMGFLLVPSARAQTDILIEVETGRGNGVSPVLERAILIKPDKPTDTALLFFRGGNPAVARIRSVADKAGNLPPFLKQNLQRFADAAIALVIMDCPTDQWDACLDRYRSSEQHADDVRRIIATLRDAHGLSRIFVLGHSLGTISSRWLAKRLGTEIAGSIHSASGNVANRLGMGISVVGFPYASIAAPVLHIHHERDACPVSPYGLVTRYAGDNLVTVRGGDPVGDPCRTHHHSYSGREGGVARAIIAWIRTGTVERVVGP